MNVLAREPLRCGVVDDVIRTGFANISYYHLHHGVDEESKYLISDLMK